MDAKQGQSKKVVTVLIGNEILSSAARKVLERMGYEVCTDMESVPRADFAIIGSYFLILGVVNQLRAIHPSMPIILIKAPSYELNGNRGDFYDVIELSGSSEAEACGIIGKWFTEGHGKFLIKKRKTDEKAQ